MSSESTITDEIRARYVRDPRLRHPTEVAVSERNGTVTLRGTVSSFRQHQAAVEIAKSVTGVGVVQDQLFVDPRDHWEDEELKGAALQALYLHQRRARREDRGARERRLGDAERAGQAPAGQQCEGGLPPAPRRWHHEQDQCRHRARLVSARGRIVQDV